MKERSEILALPGNKQWVCSKRAIERILLIDEQGQLMFEAALPWLNAILPNGKRVDVVGLQGLAKPMIVDSLDQVENFVALRPILVSTNIDMSEVDERSYMWTEFALYLPLASQQIIFHASRFDGKDRYDEFLVSVPAVVEASDIHEPKRYCVSRFTISRWCRS